MTLCFSLMWGCDKVKVPPAPDAGGEVKGAEVEAPHRIEPKVWGEAGEGARYEVRTLPDGRPGLFDADGALLVELIPELILDVGAAQKGRVPPARPTFDLVKLDAHEGGGFSLFGRVEDINGVYDLRVENGKGDPRVHVEVGAKWKRPVSVHRLVPVFRTGPFSEARALGHDYRWREVESEWIDPANTPDLLRFGDDALTVVGRQGVEGVSARRVADDRWDVELEMYHFENHPADLGEGCEESSLAGVARFEESERLSMRADFVVGAVDAPLVSRYPEGKLAAVALSGTGEGGAARVYAAGEAGAGLALRTAPDTWNAASMEEVPCADGRFTHLGTRGFRSAWAVGSWAPEGDGGNALFASEVDARAVFAFRHPTAKLPSGDRFVMFTVSTVPPESAGEWFSESALAALGQQRGLVSLRTDLDTLLSADVSATATVRDTLAAASDTVWVAPVGEVAERLVALGDVEVDVLPEGVLRVRNPTMTELPGFTLQLPPGTTARYNPEVQAESSEEATWFDLGRQREQLVQLFRGTEPAAVAKPAQIEVVRDAP